MALSVTFLTAAVAAFAQVAPATPQPATASTAKSAAEVILLNPFEVATNKDTGYGALNTTSIGAINMEMHKSPVAADIFTEQFLQDVAMTNVEDLLANYGAGYGQVMLTPDTNANQNLPGDRPGAFVRVGSRGVSGGRTFRNGFVASPTGNNITDLFDTERVEMVKGANALLFGAGGAGGFTNIQSKQARFGSDRSPLLAVNSSLAVDQYGTKRWEFDAGYGLKKISVRLVALDEDKNFRRLYVGTKTHGYYAGVSAKLPFNSTLKFNARKTDQNRIIPGQFNDLNFANAARDPRHNFSLSYLLATDQAGAVNPKTGVAYPGGAVLNGMLSWDNASSWGGWAQAEDITNVNLGLSIDTVWTRWLATSVAATYEHTVGQRRLTSPAPIAPRAFNANNPFLNGEWAVVDGNLGMDREAGRSHAYRGSAVITNDFLQGRAKSQTVVGYNLNFNAAGTVNYLYYEADANFRAYDLSNPRPAVVAGTTVANALGRYALPSFYWPVNDGPVKKPFFRVGARQIAVNGKNYVLLQQNPRNPAWVSPLNPVGLLSLSPGFSSIGGSNAGHYAWDDKDWGLYGANYTGWFDDRLTTLVGYRLSHTFNRGPNLQLTGTEPWVIASRDANSYNFGLNYRLKPWLYAYYNTGRSFLPTTGDHDPYGVSLPDGTGTSHEIGFKYNSDNGRISGSISYYRNVSKQEMTNSFSLDTINPVGINDAFGPPSRSLWTAIDKEASGLEIILTAAPTKNLRSRLGFTQQGGKINSATAYKLLWNDEFYYNKITGGVTYSDGTPFMVPTDAAGVVQVSGTSTPRLAPVGATNTQLTLAMMGDITSDYFAYGKGAAMQSNGRLTNNSVVFRALRWFQTPSGLQARTLRPGRPLSEIPYVFSDPAGLKGVWQVSRAGEPTVGHPLYRFVWTNTYDVTEGLLRGITLGATTRWDVDKRTYWYSEPDGNGGNIRLLFKEGAINPQVSTFLAYRRKVGRYLFRSQLNVNNQFNRYRVELRPARATGFTTENAINATFVGEPRQYLWTNSVSF